MKKISEMKNEEKFSKLAVSVIRYILIRILIFFSAHALVRSRWQGSNDLLFEITHYLWYIYHRRGSGQISVSI